MPDPAAPESNGIELSVVMPCLNEARTLATCIQWARDCMEKHGIRGEVVVGDNGSSDGSQEIARNAGARVVDVPVKGYGAALMGAIEAAEGRYVVMGDCDMSYDFTHVHDFLAKLREGFDLVMGNRFRGGIAKGAMPALHQYFGNPFLTRVGRLFFRYPIGDIQCGLRGFSKEAYRKMDLRCTAFEFASEMVVKSAIHGLKITEIPTTLSPDGRDRAPHLKSFSDGWRNLRFMLMYSPRWLFLYPGGLLMVLGLVAGGALLAGPVTIGSVTFDVHTLMYAAGAVILGFQAILFALFTKVYGINAGLLPEDARLERLFQRFKLEHGLLAGIALMLVGVAGTVVALLSWGQESFGDLEYSRMMRLVIPSVTSLALGFQVFLSSFFLSVLGLRKR